MVDVALETLVMLGVIVKQSIIERSQPRRNRQALLDALRRPHQRPVKSSIAKLEALPRHFAVPYGKTGAFDEQAPCLDVFLIGLVDTPKNIG